MNPEIIRDWERLKSDHHKVILLVRVGDYYELYAEDAYLASRICGLTLSNRTYRGKPFDVLGIIHYDLDKTVRQLKDAGLRCAVYKVVLRLEIEEVAR